MRRLLEELKRRKVYRVAVAYVAVAFVVVEAADLLFPALNIPPWAYSLVVVLALLGFPVALVLTWAFEVTPEGVERTRSAPYRERAVDAAADSAPASGRAPGRLVGTGLVGLGLLAAAGAGAWYLAAPGGEPEPRAGERSIAVLPFEALGQREPGPFTEGMHDDLLARLSNVSGLDVISRTSVQRYRGTEKTTAEIAGELGVAWILEGGVQEMGDRIQVNAQLIDPRSDTHAWAETYRRDLTAEDLFDIQSDITGRITRSLEARLTSGEEERLAREPTEDLEAYRLYVRGRTHLEGRTERGIRQATEAFHQAIARDSSYALAWAGLADARILLANYELGPADSVLPEAQEAAERALELDPELAEAHASLGLLVQDLRTDGPGAVRNLRRAIELKPNYARAHHWLGALLWSLGHVEEGLSRVERAAELDPMSPSIHAALYRGYADVGRTEEALRAARRSEELAPDYVLGPVGVGEALLRLGRPGEARAAFRRALERTEASARFQAWTRALLAIAHLRAGDPARANELRSTVERGPFPLPAAWLHAEAEAWNAALAALERVDYTYYVNPGSLRYEPLFDPLRDDPRFLELLERVNRTWGLGPDGSFPDGR